MDVLVNWFYEVQGRNLLWNVDCMLGPGSQGRGQGGGGWGQRLARMGLCANSRAEFRYWPRCSPGDSRPSALASTLVTIQECFFSVQLLQQDKLIFSGVIESMTDGGSKTWRTSRLTANNCSEGTQLFVLGHLEQNPLIL